MESRERRRKPGERTEYAYDYYMLIYELANGVRVSGQYSQSLSIGPVGISFEGKQAVVIPFTPLSVC
jgi:hypothetical protein